MSTITRIRSEDPAFCECCTPMVPLPRPTLEELSRLVLQDRLRGYDQLIYEERRPGSLVEWLREAVLFLLEQGRDQVRSDMEAAS